MQKQLLVTADGSHTLYVPDLNENYHSSGGAVQEALHVYVNAGLDFVKKDELRILEVGFGTGLNTILMLQETERLSKKVYYETIEAYPVEQEIWEKLNYSSFLSTMGQNYFSRLHTCQWSDTTNELANITTNGSTNTSANKSTNITPNFSFKKININLQDYVPNSLFDIIYFDAFAPDIQPEMWTQAVFEKMYGALYHGGILLTYSSKGMVKQNLRAAGFTINRLAGAGNKRHMLRAVKT